MSLRACAAVGAAFVGLGTAHAEPEPPGTGLLPMFLTDEQLLAHVETAGAELIELEGTAPVLPVTASERVLDEHALATLPRRSADDLLRAVPGLYLSSHGAEGKAQQFFLRGFDAVHGSDLEVRVAGIVVNEPSNVHGHGYVDLGFVIPEVVAEVRAREGSFALDQGDFATAGSVAMELGTSHRGARAGYQVGTTGRHRVVGVLAPDGGAREQVVAVEAMRDDGYGENRGAERLGAVAQTRIAAGRGWIQPVAFAYVARFGEPGVLPVADVARGMVAYDGALAGGEGRSQRALVGLRAGAGRATGGVWLGWRGLSLDENFTGYLLDEEHGDRRLQEHRATSAGGAGEWKRAVGESIDVVVGGEVRGDLVGQTEDGLTEAGEVWQQTRSLRASTVAGGVRAGLEGRRGGLRGAVGVRLDALHADVEDRLMARRGAGAVAAASPRVSLAWERARGGVYAAYGRGLRSPEARAFAAGPERHAGDGDASITTSDAVEVGGRVTFGPVAVSAAGFATRIAREAIFDHVSGANVELDGTRRAGAELAVAYAPVTWLTLRGDVSAVDARFEVTGNPVPGAPRLLAQGELHVERGAWSAGVHAVHVGARPLGHGATGGASTVVDALAGWRQGAWQVGLQVDNLLGGRWSEGEYHFASWWDRSAPRSTLPRLHYSAGRPLGARLAITMWF